MDIFRLRRNWGFLSTLAAILVISSLTLWITGCGTASSVSNATFTYSDLADPHSLDPAQVDDQTGANIVTYLYDGLVSYDATTGEAKPDLAESWDISDNATVFTFHLKKGSKFSNGREVKAQDFLYAWTRALDPATKSETAQSVLGAIKGAQDVMAGKSRTLTGVETPDDYTLKVTLVQPMADFITFMGQPASMPVPKEEIDKPGAKFAEAPFGNGPFMVKEWRHNDAVVLTTNPDFSGTKPKISEVTVRIIPDSATAVQELKAGNLDAVRGIKPGQVESLRNDSSVKLLDSPGSGGVRFLGFNITSAPFDNATVRQAVAYAIDKQTLADKVLQGRAQPADGIVPPSVFGHQSNAMPYNFDVEKAKSLLAQAGYPGGQGLPRLTLSYPNVSVSPDLAQAIQAQLKQVGISVELQGLEPNTFTGQMMSGKLPIFVASWQDVPVFDSYLYALFDSDNIGATDVFNYQNKDVDNLITKARGTTDAGARNSLYNEAQSKILADAPAVPLVFDKDVIPYSPKVTNMVYTPAGLFALNDITVSTQ